MSEHAARQALSRIHLRDLAIAPIYTGMASDLQCMAMANAEERQAAFSRLRGELAAAYGGEQAQEQIKPFSFVSGIAIIPVHGTLINRFGYSWSYVTGYNFIRQQTALAGQDPEVLGIVYDHNSYGGEAAGCFECSNDIAKLANGKPTISVIDSNCYSASYAMACGTDKIYSMPSGGSGSVGVVAGHVSMEKMLEKFGIEVTFIFAGAHKVDGNPYEALPESVKADIQKSVNKSYYAFVALVAKGRGLDEKAVRATEARTYRADEAMSLGLIDAVATPAEAFRAFMGELSGSNSHQPTEDAMSNEAKGVDEKRAQEEAQAQAVAKARTEERARIVGITTCEEAKGRETLANHIACNTSMSVEDAKAMLAVSPKAEVTPKNTFKEAMDKGKHPEVGADDTGGQEAEGEQSSTEKAQGLLSFAQAQGIRGFKKPDAKH